MPSHAATASPRLVRWSGNAATAAAPAQARIAHDPHDAARLLAELRPTAPNAPATAGWAFVLGYELAAAFEPRLALPPSPSDADPWPALLLFRVQGSADEANEPAIPADPAAYEVGTIADELPETGYAAGVRAILRLIAAGDCYQANLARRLRATFTGSARAFFADLAAAARPRHGFYAEHTETAPGQPPVRRAICSASPELFLEGNLLTGLVRTRPMKGTRPLGAPEAELFHAEKDRAELDMIVDLMRNDLGRVARFGSVRVESPRTIERHDGGVLQATASVAARLRAGVTFLDLLAATFPAGSVTGAPKIRAMQIIDELEPFRRGAFCGSSGWLGDDGNFSLNVNIRTATITGTPSPGERDRLAPDRFAPGATLHYPVGAGIVADSDPDAELAETELKALALRAVESREKATP